MKKLLSLLLALALMAAGTAMASEWQPGRPYRDVPEIDLSQSLGYMILTPNSMLPASYVCQQLRIYLPRTDVKAGEGSLRVTDGESSEIWSAPMADASVTLRPMREDEKTMLLWEDGVCFDIRLGRSLPLNVPCTVTLDPDCIVSLDGAVGNPAISGDGWVALASGDFGVGGMAYLRDGEAVVSPAPGDQIRFDLTLGGEAAFASLYSPDGSVRFPVGSLPVGGEVTGEVVGDAPVWGVIFLDATGVAIAQVSFE